MNKNLLAALALVLIALLIYLRNRKVEFEIELKVEPPERPEKDNNAVDEAEPSCGASETPA